MLPQTGPAAFVEMIEPMAALHSVAEKTFTGIETKPKLIESEAIERAAIMHPRNSRGME
ncbi:hypothetical protein AB4120_14160 [Cupriavidus sp. 2KB_3]|uniref:hypothetical protein n=1 Tax=Cupriavidus sp. 2KB_3 TaxID=3232980 RepID=UPI003F92F8E2